MVQVSIPTSNVFNDWALTGVIAGRPHQALDEGISTPDEETTYCQGIDPNFLHVGMGAISRPGQTSGFTVRIRYKQVGAATAGIPRRIIIGITNQGGTTFGTIEVPLDHTAYATVIAPIPDAIVAAVTSWATFGISLLATGITARVTTLEVHAPNVIPMRATRHSVLVLGKHAPNHRVSRQEVLVLGKHLPVHRVTRQEVYVIGKKLPNLKVTRQAAYVLGKVEPFKVVPLPMPEVLPPLFPANWIETVRIVPSFKTDVQASPDTVAEERLALAGRPVRDVSVRFTSMNRRMTQRLLMLLARRSHERAPFPLYPHMRPVTASSTGKTLWCSTTYRPFFNGARVVVYENTSHNTVEPKNVQYAEIVKVFADRLELKANLTGTVPVGAIVIPCIDAEVNLSGDAPLVTDEHISLTLNVSEVRGRSALPATVGPYMPNGQSSHPSPVDGEALPILAVRPDWGDGLRTSYLRTGESYASGRDEVVKIDGERPHTLHDLRFTLMTREDYWTVLQLFESRRARCRPFWCVSPSAFFKAAAITTTHVDVERDGNIEDLETFVKFVGLVPLVGPPIIRGIDSIVDTGTVFRITFDDAIPSTPLASLERVTVGHLARFDSDAMVETWVTDEHVLTEFTAHDLIAEEASEATNLEQPTGSGSVPSLIDDLYAWFVAGSNAFAVTEASPTIVQRAKYASPLPQPIATWDDTRSSPSSPHLQAATSVPMYLAQFASATSNKGRPSVVAGALLKNGFNLRELSSESCNPFWDNTEGLTIFINCILFVDTTADDEDTDFLKRAGIFEWEMALPIPRIIARFYETDGVSVSTHHVEAIGIDPRDKVRHTWVVTWNPSQYARMYRDGTLIGSAAAPVASMPTTDRPTSAMNWKSAFNVLTTPNKNLLNKNGAYFNEMLIYKRALTNAEINDVGHHLEYKYGLGNSNNAWVDL